MATNDQRRSLIDQIPLDTYQTPKPNSFGDAAAPPSPGLVQMAMNAPTRPLSPPPAPAQTSPAPPAQSGPLQRSLVSMASSYPPSTPGSASGSLVDRAFSGSQATNKVNFDPATNAYSGGNIAGDISLNGAAPSASGLVSRAFGAAAPAPVQPPSPGQSLIDRAFAPRSDGQEIPQFQAPQVSHSGNDYAARKQLENLATSASSITNTSRWGGRGAEGNPAVRAYRQALATDSALQQAEPGLENSAMQANTALLREGMEQGGNQQRSLVQAAMDQQRGQNDLTRTTMTEEGANQRALISALGTVQAAQTRAAAGNAPSGYRFNAKGGLEAIPGGPADKSQAPLNDVQSKALQFGSRMEESDRNLTKLAAQGVNQPGLIKRAADAIGIGGAANWTQSPQQQQVEQSQRDFINAVLRRESGAAIADSEFDNARKQYFPQPGDAPDVIQQKMRNRAIATAGIKAEVPNAEDRIGQVLGAGRAPTSEVGGLPTGMTKQIGTSGGKPVYEDAQGNRFVGG